jgi:hypothetical protein
MYEAGKTLTLPSNKCYFPTDCIVDLGYEISGTNCICANADTYSWTSLSQIPGTPETYEIAEGGRCDEIPICTARGTGKQLD